MKHATLHVGVAICSVLMEKKGWSESSGISSYRGEGDVNLLSEAGSTKPKW